MEGDSKNPGSDRGGPEGEAVAEERKSTSSMRQLRKMQEETIRRASNVLETIKHTEDPDDPPTKVDIPRPPLVPTETKKKRHRQRTR